MFVLCRCYVWFFPSFLFPVVPRFLVDFAPLDRDVSPPLDSDTSERGCPDENSSAFSSSFGWSVSKLSEPELGLSAYFLFSVEVTRGASLLCLGFTSLISKLKNLLYRPTCSHLKGIARAPKGYISPSSLILFYLSGSTISISPFLSVWLSPSTAYFNG